MKLSDALGGGRKSGPRGTKFGDQVEVYGPSHQNVLIPLLRSHIIENNKKIYDPKDEPRFSPSSIGGCGRALLLKLQGYEDDKGAESLFTLETGTFLHKLIQEQLKNHPLFLAMEEKIQFPGINGNGYFDLIMNIDGEPLLIDIKSTNQANFERLHYSRKVSEKYELQINMYLESKQISKGLFLFVNRNGMVSSEFKKKFRGEFDELFLEIPVVRNSDKYKLTVDKTKMLINHFEQGTLPEYVKCSDCNYCPKEIKERCKISRKLEKIERKNGTR